MNIEAQAKTLRKQYKNKKDQVFIINCPNVEIKKKAYLKIRQVLNGYYVIFSATESKEHSFNVYSQKTTEAKTFEELKQIALRVN